MRKTNVIRILGGLITVDKVKLDMICTFIIYAALSFARIALIIATIVFGLLMIAAGGDGHTNLGDPGLMVRALSLAFLCGCGVKFTTTLKESLIEGIRYRNERRTQTNSESAKTVM